VPHRASRLPIFLGAPDIATGPKEPVHFRRDDPRMVVVQTHPALDRNRNLNGVIGWRVTDGYDVGDHAIRELGVIFVTQDDRTRTIFQSFYLFLWPFGFSCGMAQRLPGVTGLSHRLVKRVDDEQSAPVGAQTNIWQGG
jgi:hypothetical protein